MNLMFQFKIPARILTIDYFGVTTAFAAKYRRRALKELHLMAYEMEFKNLKQYRRERILDSNVKVVCDYIFGVATALVIIGYQGETSMLEHVCFCSTFGLVAARITSINDISYDEDTDYVANAVICQQTGIGQPKRIEVRTVKEVGGDISETLEHVYEKSFFISHELINIPFTDRYQHTEGSLILMLIMPLVDFRPTVPDCFPYGMEYKEKQGSWSPEVNRRSIVGNQFEDPEALITSLYLASSGMSGAIMADSNLWLGNPNAEPPVDPQPKFNPFRILPIEMNSCISTGL
jgi:hypothetical protein